MIRGGEVEIEGGKLSLEEQLALAEAAEKAKQEAEALAQKEAEEAWNKYKDEQLVIATAKASSLTASTCTLDLAGRSANISGAVTIGTRGNILWGERGA